jgi:rSAM-associated Gly-rich repeat protein
MKITPTAGLVGFLLALSSVNVPKADAKTDNSTTEKTELSVESRLTRISKVIRENQAVISNQNNPIYLAAAFLNSSPSFRNNVHGWINNVRGWGNKGSFVNHNSGSGFVNKSGGGGFYNR